MLDHLGTGTRRARHQRLAGGQHLDPRHRQRLHVARERAHLGLGDELGHPIVLDRSHEDDLIGELSRNRTAQRYGEGLAGDPVELIPAHDQQAGVRHPPGHLGEPLDQLAHALLLADRADEHHPARDQRPRARVEAGHVDRVGDDGDRSITELEQRRGASGRVLAHRDEVVGPPDRPGLDPAASGSGGPTFGLGEEAMAAVHAHHGREAQPGRRGPQRRLRPLEDVDRVGRVHPRDPAPEPTLVGQGPHPPHPTAAGEPDHLHPLVELGQVVRRAVGADHRGPVALLDDPPGDGLGERPDAAVHAGRVLVADERDVHQTSFASLSASA